MNCFGVFITGPLAVLDEQTLDPVVALPVCEPPAGVGLPGVLDLNPVID
jgi:hypothetical protein